MKFRNFRDHRDSAETFLTFECFRHSRSSESTVLITSITVWGSGAPIQIGGPPIWISRRSRSGVSDLDRTIIWIRRRLIWIGADLDRESPDLDQALRSVCKPEFPAQVKTG